MEENVALDSKKKKKFLKSIRGIKKLIKKNEKAEPQKKDETVKPKKPFSMKLKHGKINKKKRRKERGLVYLSHIPHGFYEHQMTEYFKQFGVVTNVRVIKSKRTGQSKGFAFVEFMEPAVGQIVAETMNNYLMGKRLIKAAYIPPEKQKHNAFRKNWNSVNNPGSQKRLQLKKAFNADKDENGELKRARKLLSNLTKNKKKLSELGINYDFFMPVDIPEALLNQAIKEEKKDESIKQESIPKKAKKGKQEHTEDKKQVQSKKVEIDKQPQQNVNEVKGKKNKTNKQENKVAEVDKKGKIVEAKKENLIKIGKKEKVPVQVNEKQQKEKEQKLKNAGVKPAQEFIKIDEDSGDESDSSYAFDSDEYEKMLEEENNSDLPSGGNDDDDEASEDDEESDEEEISTRFVKKGKSAPKVVQAAQGKKQVQNQQSPKRTKKQDQRKPSIETPKKAPQKSAALPRKPKKFEKYSQKPMKKQFKKK